MRKTSEIIWQDAQHQVLFEILEMIRDPDCDRQVLDRLKYYTENHFTLEEQYMQAIDFPGRQAHIESHDRFRGEIDQLLGEGQEFDALSRDIISTFLTEWLTRHVFGIDKELEAFIMQCDVK